MTRSMVGPTTLLHGIAPPQTPPLTQGLIEPALYGPGPVADKCQPVALEHRGDGPEFHIRSGPSPLELRGPLQFRSLIVADGGVEQATDRGPADALVVVPQGAHSGPGVDQPQ